MEHSSTIDVNAHQEDQAGLIRMMIEDIRCALYRDPAARNWFEVLINYSGLHAIWFYRFTHWLWVHKIFFLARWFSQIARLFTGVEIHPGATIGRRFFIDHGMGVVIGETSKIGDDVTLYHGVTLGGVNLQKGKRHPTLGNKVVVGAGAKILGAIEIGDGSRIGANAVVVRSVPSEAVVVGVPGQVVKRSEKRVSDLPDLHHDRLPDTLGIALRDVMQRLERMEEKMHVGESKHIQTDEDGCWVGLDFSI
jgi:serine O-acetyltransferase